MSSIASPTTTMRCDTILRSRVSRRSLGSRVSVTRGVIGAHEERGAGSGTLRCAAPLRLAPSGTAPRSPLPFLSRTLPLPPEPIRHPNPPHPFRVARSRHLPPLVHEIHPAVSGRPHGAAG